MVTFIIVDDNKQLLKQIKDIILKVTFSNKKDINIKCFSKYDSELQSIIDDTTLNKVYILDIELANSISGVDIAKIIRDKDLLSNIIIVTSHDSLFETVYRSLYNIFDFIEKLGEFKGKLTKDINLILNKKYDYESFNYSNRNLSLQVQFRHIVYIYRDTVERKVIIKTDLNTYVVPLTLLDVENQLDARFVKVHRACIVNRDRIEKYNWAKGYFKTDLGEKVDMLSKKYRSDIEND